MSSLPEQTNPWRIRWGTKEDINALMEIERDAARRFESLGWELQSDDNPEGFLHSLQHGKLWVAEEGKAPIGFARTLDIDSTLHLKEVSVAYDHQKRGVGRSLVNAVVEHGRWALYPAVTLTTFANVGWNAPFYRQLGFMEMADEGLSPALVEILEDEEDRGLGAFDERIAMAKRL